MLKTILDVKDCLPYDATRIVNARLASECFWDSKGFGTKPAPNEYLVRSVAMERDFRALAGFYDLALPPPPWPT